MHIENVIQEVWTDGCGLDGSNQGASLARPKPGWLAELHEEGILTDEEFSAKKTELLSRL